MFLQGVLLCLLFFHLFAVLFISAVMIAALGTAMILAIIMAFGMVGKRLVRMNVLVAFT